MLDAVVECLVARRNTIGTYLARLFMIIVDALMVSASLFVLLYIPAFGILICVFGGIIWLVTWLVLRYTRVEYEYAFFDGELTIDKILNKSKRKRIGRYNFNKLEYITKSDSPRLHNVKKQAVEIDCTAKDEALTDYSLYIIEEGNKSYLVSITPNEELLETISKKYSRKFVD